MKKILRKLKTDKKNHVTVVGYFLCMMVIEAPDFSRTQQLLSLFLETHV